MRQAPDLKQLQREWYDRLARDGFADIETGAQHDGLLATDKRIVANKATEYAAQAEYYRRCSSFLFRHRFASRLDHDIWALHTEGKPYRRIVHQLRERGAYLKLVHQVVGRLRRTMLGDGPRRGRPEKPTGYHRSSYRINLRLTDDEAELLFYVAAQLMCTHHEALRAALRICGTTNRGTAVPMREREKRQSTG